MAAINRTSVRIRLGTADALEFLLLEDAKYLGLQRQRHVADLVEEQRAAVALLEFADMTAVGSGERTFFMTEQFALQQVLRNGGAVEGEEWGLGSVAMLVEARATNSLPVPLSPVISTGTSWAATRPMALYTSRIP